MKLNKFLTSISCAALLVGAGACTEEIKYEPAAPENGPEVYFPNYASTTVALLEDATEFSVEIARLRDEQAITVNLSGATYDADGAELPGIFTIPGSVSFNAGEKTTTIPVAVDFSKVVAEEVYSVKIVLEDYTTPYGAAEQTFQVSYQPWTPWQPYSASGEYGSATLSAFRIEDDEITVYYSQSTVYPKIKYQFGDYGCPDLQPDPDLQTWIVNGRNFTFIRDTETNVVSMPQAETGDTGTFGSMLYVSDIYTFAKEYPQIAAGIQDLEDPERFAEASTYDPETGVFSIFMAYYTVDQAVTFQWEYYGLPGFAVYDMTFQKMGNFVTVDGAEQIVISAYRTDDLASYKYDLVEGGITSENATASLQALLANEEAPVVTEQLTNLAFTLTNDGDYGIIVAGYDAAGNHVYSTYYNFTYESVQKVSEYTPIGKAMYTDGFLYSVYDDLGGTSWEVEVEQHKLNPGIIRLVNPYQFPTWDEGMTEWNLDGNYYITINMEDPNRVYIYESKLGIQTSSQQGPLYVSSMAYDYMFNGDDPFTAEELDELGCFGKVEDGIITFPGASLFFTYSDANAAAGRWLNTNLDPELADPNVATSQEEYTTAVMEQLGSIGWFELDLNELETSEPAAAKKRVAREHESGVSNMLTKSSNLRAIGRGRKIGATISGKELMEYNAEHGVRLF